MKRVSLAAVLLAASLTACGTQAPVSTATSPTETATPKPPVEIVINDCGYGDFGIVTMAGTVTNNTGNAINFLYAVVALIKNGQVVRTDEISIVNASGQNAGLIHGLDYRSKAGQLAPAESLSWSVAYPLNELTQPFECEASITDAR